MSFLKHFYNKRRLLLALFFLALVVLPLVPIGVERAYAFSPCGLTVAMDECMNGILSTAAYGVMTIMGWLVGAAGYVLEFVVDTTIVGMRGIVAPLLRDGGAIAVAWQAIRNLANAMFIFVILYIAISTILKANTHAMHQLLGRLIIAALLINFSLFFSKAIIDASNVLTQGFYTRFVTPDGKTPVSLAKAIVNPLQIVTIFKPPVDPTKVENFRQGLGSGQLITMMVVGSIFLLITALVLFVIAVLLAVRFALLMLLMAFSPIGFVGMIVPALSGWGRQWWTTLLNQAFFAPVFFMMMYIVVSILNSPEYFSALFGNPPAGTTLVFSDANGSGTADSMRLAFSFLIVIVMVLAALAVSKSMASKGSMGVTNWATKFAGGAVLGTAAWGGRKFIGGASRRIAESKFMQDAAANSRFGGMRLVQKSFKGVAGSSFDARGVAAKVPGVDLGRAGGKGGYEATFKRKVKAREDYAKGLGEGQVSDRGRAAQAAAAAAETEYTAATTALDEAQRNSSVPMATQAERDAAAQAVQNATLRQSAAYQERERTRRDRGNEQMISRQEAYARRSGGLIDEMIGRRLGTGYASTAAERIEKAAVTARLKKQLPQINLDIRQTENDLRRAVPADRPALEARLRDLYERRERGRSGEHAETIARLEELRGGGGGGAGGGRAAGGGAAAGGGTGGGGAAGGGATP